MRRTLYSCTMSYDLVCNSAFVLDVFLNAIRHDVAEAHPDYIVTAASYTNDNGSITVVVEGDNKNPMTVQVPPKWRGPRAEVGILDECPLLNEAKQQE